VAPSTTSGADAQGKININTADAGTLQQLNGVGPSTAQKIIDYRASVGAFHAIEDIMNVSGIGQKTFEKLKPNITV
jgi:competence protein ComEA